MSPQRTLTSPSRLLLTTVFWLLATLPLISCDSSEKSPSGLPTIQMQLGQKSYTLEVAADDKSRTYGLMRRDSMPENHGMIFSFNSERPLAFYMKNTRIPLDIIFVDSTGNVVSVKQMQPYDENTTPSDGNAQYAIELNKGQAKSAAITPGTKLQIPDSIKTKN